MDKAQAEKLRKSLSTLVDLPAEPTKLRNAIWTLHDVCLALINDLERS